MNTETRKLMGLTEMPVNANYHKQPPVVGIAALFAFGFATGFGIATIIYVYAL